MTPGDDENVMPKHAFDRLQTSELQPQMQMTYNGGLLASDGTTVRSGTRSAAAGTAACCGGRPTVG